MSQAETPGKTCFAVRRTRGEDISAIARLATQLGYPSSAEQVKERLDLIRDAPEHAVWVAEHNGEVIAWIHVFVCRVLESDPRAEVGGLVVDEAFRGNGAGRLLVERAEQWAREKCCRGVSVRSNVIRAGAHSFYEGLGYVRIKTQHAFRKDF